MGIYPQTAHPGGPARNVPFPALPKSAHREIPAHFGHGFLGGCRKCHFLCKLCTRGVFWFFRKIVIKFIFILFLLFFEINFYFFYYFFYFFLFFYIFLPTVTGLPTQPWCKCPDLHARSDVLANVQEFRSLRRSPSWRMIVRSSSSLKISGRVGHISLTRSTRVDRLSGFRPFSNDISGRFDLE